MLLCLGQNSFSVATITFPPMHFHFDILYCTMLQLSFFPPALTYLHLFQFHCHSNLKLDYLEQTSTAISPRYSGNTSFILLGSCTMHVHSRQPRHARMHLYKGLFSLTESLDKQKSKKMRNMFEWFAWETKELKRFTCAAMQLTAATANRIKQASEY